MVVCCCTSPRPTCPHSCALVTIATAVCRSWWPHLSIAQFELCSVKVQSPGCSDTCCFHKGEEGTPMQYYSNLFTNILLLWTLHLLPAVFVCWPAMHAMIITNSVLPSEFTSYVSGLIFVFFFSLLLSASCPVLVMTGPSHFPCLWSGWVWYNEASAPQSVHRQACEREVTCTGSLFSFLSFSQVSSPNSSLPSSKLQLGPEMNGQPLHGSLFLLSRSNNRCHGSLGFAWWLS